VLTGCWIGFDQPQSLGKDQTGGNVCGPIWNEFMKVALADQPDLDFAVPSGVTLQQTSFNGQTVTEAFKTNQVPGAQSNDSLLAGQNGLDSAPGGTPNGSSATPGAPAASGSQPLLGGLY
jgi:penicillin-binding protein 1A